jgi:BON domain
MINGRAYTATDVIHMRAGEVTFKGSVDSRYAKRRAENLADRVSGVRHVQHTLRVQSVSTSQAADEAIEGTTASLWYARLSGVSLGDFSRSRSLPACPTVDSPIVSRSCGAARRTRVGLLPGIASIRLAFRGVSRGRRLIPRAGTALLDGTIGWGRAGRLFWRCMTWLAVLAGWVRILRIRPGLI